MRIAAIVLLLATSVPAHASSGFSDALEREAIVEVMTAAAEWQLAHPSKHPRWDWTQAPFWAGLMAFAPLSEDPDRYRAAVRANGEEIDWRPGPRPLCADDHAIAQSFFMLHRLEADPEIIRPSLQLFDAVVLYPFDESLEFESWEKTWRQWTWCDALFMSPPALAMASRATGDPKYREFMHRMWWKTTDYLYDDEEHLYYRDSRFFDQRSANGEKIFWSRGNGWVLAGLARVIANLPEEDEERPRYVKLFRDMAAKIATLQQPDGYWRTSLLDPDVHPLPETSGTAFYVYALAWGVNEGLLNEEEYLPVIRRGWSALVRALHADGMLGWVQRIGDQPGATTAEGTEIYGVGGLLLAGSEVARLATND
ncbi:MAG: glycoside hydrolase family 88/105 protein [Thermoanaerobaculia bacterium]